MGFLNQIFLASALGQRATRGSGHERVGDVAIFAAVVDGSLTLDFAESLFILLHIVAEGEQKVLGILRGHYDAALHLGLGHIGGDGDEIDKHLV